MSAAVRARAVARCALLAGALASLAAGCSLFDGEAEPIPEAFRRPRSREHSDYNLRVGDDVLVKFLYRPELSEQQLIRPDGRITLPLVGEMEVVGMTSAELSRKLEELFVPQIGRAGITVILRGLAERVVFVGGEVRSPGVLPFSRPPTLRQAVLATGGLKRTARANKVVLLRDDGAGSPVHLVVDMRIQEDPEKDGGAILLEPFDVVFVPKTEIARVNDFVDQYIDEVIPQAVQNMVGFNYLYNDGGVGVSGGTP